MTIISLLQTWVTSASPVSPLTAALDFSAAIEGSEMAEDLEPTDHINFQSVGGSVMMLQADSSIGIWWRRGATK